MLTGPLTSARACRAPLLCLLATALALAAPFHLLSHHWAGMQGPALACAAGPHARLHAGPANDHAPCPLCASLAHHFSAPARHHGPFLPTPTVTSTPPTGQVILARRPAGSHFIRPPPQPVRALDARPSASWPPA